MGWMLRRNIQSAAVDCFDDVRDGRIEIEVSKVFVVYRLVHAPAIFRSDSNDQFVDQGVAHSLYLTIRPEIGGGVWRMTNGDTRAGSGSPNPDGCTGRGWRLNFPSAG